MQLSDYDMPLKARFISLIQPLGIFGSNYIGIFFNRSNISLRDVSLSDAKEETAASFRHRIRTNPIQKQDQIFGLHENQDVSFKIEWLLHLSS